MARNWTLQFTGGKTERLASSAAAQGVVPTTLHPADKFDAAADESVILKFGVPAEHTGTGTLKLAIYGCANTTTAADDARIDVATEFKTPGAAEAMNSANIDATPDSGTMTFSTTAYSLQLLTITLTPAVAPVAGDEGRIQVTRDADNAGSLDDLASDLFVTRYELYEEV